jgi:hypothetical protein
MRTPRRGRLTRWTLVIALILIDTWGRSLEAETTDRPCPSLPNSNLPQAEAVVPGAP